MSIITKNHGRLGDGANVDQRRDKIALPWSKSKMSNVGRLDQAPRQVKRFRSTQQNKLGLGQHLGTSR
jgi:hypothetical protein